MMTAVNVLQLYCDHYGVSVDSLLGKRIRVSQPKFFRGGFAVYSMGVKLTKREQGDDHAFLTTPGLTEAVPRGKALVLRKGKVVCILGGFRKFLGVKALHDDDISDLMESSAGVEGAAALLKVVTDTTDKDTKKLYTWAQEGNLLVEETNKENGKFANVMLFYDEEEEKEAEKKEEQPPFIVCGSKGNHLITTIADIDDTLAELRAGGSKNTIMVAIVQEIKRIYPQLLLLESQFRKGRSLTGELKDGKHFCPVPKEQRNTIAWFSVCRQTGVPLTAGESAAIFSAAGIATVTKQVTFEPGQPVAALDAVLYNSALVPFTEGSVLYCWNTLTNENINLKQKSPWYIFWRGWRGMLLADGYKNIEAKMLKWMVDKCAGASLPERYLKFSTAAAIHNVEVAYGFARWLMFHKYPVGVLGHMAEAEAQADTEDTAGAEDTGGCGGFIDYLMAYFQAGGKDLFLEIGLFDAAAFLASPVVRMYPARAPATHRKNVLFMQGIMGIGKSTGAEYLEATMGAKIIEQDKFGGCSKTTRGMLWHLLQQPEDTVIIVSRCNAEPKEYAHYLDVCLHENAIVSFAAPNKLTPLTLAACVASCLQRPCKEQKAEEAAAEQRFLLGQTALTAAALVPIVVARYNKFVRHPQAVSYTPFAAESTLLVDAAASGGINDALLAFVRAHQAALLQLRLPVEQMVHGLLESAAAATAIVLPENKQVLYVAALLHTEHQAHLTKCLAAYVPQPQQQQRLTHTHKNHHVTLHYHGRKPQPVPAGLPVPGTPVMCHISGLVLYHFTNGCVAAAWVLKRTSPTDPLRHITALVPPHKDANFSNSFVHLPHGTKGAEDDGHVQVIPISNIPPFAAVCHWMTH